MELKLIQRFKNELIRIESTSYRVQEVSKDGMMICVALDERGCAISNKDPMTFDLNKIPLHEISIIGPQPGWACD